MINIGELLYKQATSYWLFEPSQTQLVQSEPKLITIGFELLRCDCNWTQRQLCIYEPSHDKINKMTCVPRALTCASAQSDPSSLSARRNLRPLATHRVLSQTDETVNIHVNLTLPWAPSHFVGFDMVKPSEISRPITYEFTGAVDKLLERPPCVPEVVCSIRCQVIPKNLNMILLQLLFRLAISIEQTEMVGLV